VASSDEAIIASLAGSYCLCPTPAVGLAWSKLGVPLKYPKLAVSYIIKQSCVDVTLRLLLHSCRNMVSRAPKLALVLLLAAALPAAISACNSCCTVAGLKVIKAAESAKPQESGAYAITDVQSHFYQVDENPYVKNTEATFACVDARGDNAYLMTPGGDYAEVGVWLQRSWFWCC
jgi:hypothetical protein